MSIELRLLVYSVVLLIVLVFVQALAGIRAQGLFPMAGHRDGLPPAKPYQARTRRVVENHIEGLVMFAPLVLIAAMIMGRMSEMDRARRAALLLFPRRARLCVSHPHSLRAFDRVERQHAGHDHDGSGSPRSACLMHVRETEKIEFPEAAILKDAP